MSDERYKREKAALIRSLGLPEKACWGEALQSVADLQQERDNYRAKLTMVAKEKNYEVAALQQEVSRLRDERDRYKQIAKDAVTYRLPAPVIVDIGLRQRAESAESSLLAVREAMKKILDSENMPKEAWFHEDNFASGMIEFSVNSHLAETARRALSTTSAQAEGIKARLQAEALIAAAEDQESISKFLQSGVEQWGVRDDINLKVADWLRVRAAQLTAKTGE